MIFINVFFLMKWRSSPKPTPFRSKAADSGAFWLPICTQFDSTGQKFTRFCKNWINSFRESAVPLNFVFTEAKTFFQSFEIFQSLWTALRCRFKFLACLKKTPQSLQCPLPSGKRIVRVFNPARRERGPFSCRELDSVTGKSGKRDGQWRRAFSFNC